MTNQPEVAVYAAGIFQLETGTPVLGGVGGPSNDPLLHLANRTAYLKEHTDALEAALPLKAPIASPDFTGTPQSVTPADGDDSRKIPTTEWVRAIIRGQLSKAITGGSITLTSAEAGRGTIILTGTLASNATVNVPAAAGRWIFVNRTTGAYTTTIRPTGGNGLVLAQGRSQFVFSDGTDLFAASTEVANLSLTGIPTAPTAAPTDSSAQLSTTAFVRRFARGATVLDVSGGGSFTLSDIQAAAPVLRLTGTPAAGFTIVLPGEGARWIAKNDTGQTATCKTSGQVGGVALGAGRARELWTDGSSVVSAPTEVEGVAHRGDTTAVTPAPEASGVEVITAEWVRALLAGQAFYSTGDLKVTMKAAADTGWLMLHGGTIGNAASSATVRANADTALLFALLWNNLADAQAPVLGGRGASAAADFAADKRITLPDTRGRALVGAGNGAGLTARAIGAVFGTETHILDVAQLPEHNHGGSTASGGAHTPTAAIADGGFHGHTAWSTGGGAHGHSATSEGAGAHDHGVLFDDNLGGPGGLDGYLDRAGSYVGTRTTTDGVHSHTIAVNDIGDHVHGIVIAPDGLHSHGVTVAPVADHVHAIPDQGGNGAHPNTQPSIAFNVMVKL